MPCSTAKKKKKSEILESNRRVQRLYRKTMWNWPCLKGEQSRAFRGWLDWTKQRSTYQERVVPPGIWVFLLPPRDRAPSEQRREGVQSSLS